MFKWKVQGFLYSGGPGPLADCQFANLEICWLHSAYALRVLVLIFVIVLSVNVLQSERKLMYRP